MAFTNFVTGSNATLGVGASGQGVPGGTFTNVLGLLSVNMTLANDIIDFSNNDSTYDLKRFGRQRVTGSLDFLYDPADTGQGTLLTNFRARTITALRIRPQGAGTYNEYAFDAILTSMNTTTEHNGRINCSCSFESTGDIDFDADQA